MNDLDILIVMRRAAAKTNQALPFEPYACWTGTEWIFSAVCPSDIKTKLLKS